MHLPGLQRLTSGIPARLAAPLLASPAGEGL